MKDSNESTSSARKALHVSSTDSLPGREKHLDTIHTFLKARAEEEEGPGAIYISGAPGTGKTASVTLTLSLPNMKKNFNSALINCTFIKTQSAMLKKIAVEFDVSIPKSATDKQTEKAIHRHLKRNKKKTVLVLDEIDQLEGRGQQILYQLFEWPVLLECAFTLVGVANSLDFTHRVLPRLEARSSCRPILLHFAPYSKQELLDILHHRLIKVGAEKVFVGPALEMLAAKVAAVSGDARRALEIGRRSLEVGNRKRPLAPADENEVVKSPKKGRDEGAVGLIQVKKVLDAVYGAGQQTIDSDEDNLPLQQKILVCCLLLLKKGPAKKATVGKVHEVYSRVCTRRKLGGVSQSELHNMCQLLEARGVVRVANGKETRAAVVTLQWDEDEVAAALGDKTLLSDILGDRCK